VKIINRGFEYGVIHHLIQNNTSLWDVLTSDLQMDQALIEKLIAFRAIYLNNLRLPIDFDFKKDVKTNDYLRVHSKPRRFDISKLNEPDRILYENSDFLIYHKPSGIPCHPTVDNYKEIFLAS
jgi:23S rRNA pseudouridine1911/1915/1917 synthase